MAPKTLANVRLIADREFRERARKKIFIIPTVSLAILAFLGMFAPTVIQVLTQGNSQTKLVVLDQAGTVAGQDASGLVAFLDRTLNTAGTSGSAPAKPAFAVSKAETADAAALTQQVKDGKLDSALVLSREPSGEVRFQYTTKREGVSGSVQQVRQAVNFLAASDRLERAGLNAAAQQQAFSPANFQVTSTSHSTFNNGKSDAENVANYVITTVAVVLMYVMIVMYGQWIAQGVVEEKSSRVMEIMINAATPLQLMFGKVIGVGAAAFLQMGAIIAGALAGQLLQGPANQLLLGTNGSAPLQITGSSVGLLVLAFVFFVFGFALFSALHAGMGSLVSRPEEVSQVVGPLQFLLLPGYMLSVFALTMINEPWIQALSFFPLFTPMLMLARVGVGSVEPLEIAASLLLMVVAVWGGVWLAARLYRSGVLYYGQKLSVWRVLRQPVPGAEPQAPR